MSETIAETCCEDTSCTDYSHPDHNEELARLNRIAGQIEGVKKMITERRYCPDIITQLKAISSATKSVESRILKRHLHACVGDAFKADDPAKQNQKIKELMTLFKRFD